MINFNSKFKFYSYRKRKKFKESFCYAPFNTLRFSATGLIQACCRNRYATFGKINEMTIDEIWNGNRIQQFRKNLLNYKLFDGCQFCEMMLKQRNYIFLKSLEYDAFQIKPDDITIRKFEFEISNSCNLECVMCSGELSSSIRKNREQLPPIPEIYDDSFVEQLKPYWKNITRATFAGGEPFLIPLYYKIWENILQYNSLIDNIIITNGTILNDKIKNLINRGNFYFAVSIDSFHKETYETIRKNANYEAVMSNFEYFYEYSLKNKRWITINICPLTYNCQEIPSIVDYMNKRNINIYFNQVDYPINLSLRSLNTKNLRELIQFYNNYKFNNYNTPVEKNNLNNFKALIKQITYIIQESEKINKYRLHSISDKTEAINIFVKLFKERISKFDHYKHLIDPSLKKIYKSIEKIEDDDILIQGIKNFCMEPDYIFVSEIVYTTDEKLTQRIKYLSQA